jgi:hypothetical protein
VRVDHRRLHIRMAQKLLHRPDLVSVRRALPFRDIATEVPSEVPPRQGSPRLSTGRGVLRAVTANRGTVRSALSAGAVEFKTEFKTAFRATPARYGTFEDRPRIKELPESLNVPKAPPF